MSHSRHRHLCSFIWVEKTILLVLIASTALSGCGTPTPTSQPTPTDAPTPTPLPPPAPPSPTPAPPPVSPGRLPRIYIAIDESTSIKNDCDANYYRYKVPLFLLNVVKSLGDKFKPIDSSSTPNLMLAEAAGVRAANPPIRLVSGNQTIDEIKRLLEIKEQRSFENHPFLPFLTTYTQNLSQSPNSVLFFFTDGDFTGLSSVNPKVLADQVKQQFKKIHTDFPNAKMYVFLLCAGRFENALPGSDYSVIKQTWDDINAYKYATVYGLDQDKMIPNDSETGTFLKHLLDTVFRDQGLHENSDPSPESRWGWGFLNQATDKLLYVYPPTVRLKFDSVSFDENATRPVVLLDGQELNKSFVPPAKECGLHELRITNPPPLTFYWWEADTPQFSLEKVSWHLVDGLKSLQSTNFLSPPVFYNRYLTAINTNIVLKSSWDHTDLPTTNPLLNYKNCMKFQARVNDGEWKDMTPSGDFRLANPSADKPASPVNVEYRSVWKGANNNIVTASVSSPDEEWALYYPQYKSSKIINKSFTESDNIQFKLFFDFLANNYYSPFGNYKANLEFTGFNCPSSINRFNPELTREQDAIVVTLIPDSIDKGAKWVNCKNLEVSWETTLPTGKGWVDPEKLKIACVLHWRNDSAANGIQLDSIECKQGGE